MSDTTIHPALFKPTTARSGWNPHGLRFVEGTDPAAGGGGDPAGDPDPEPTGDPDPEPTGDPEPKPTPPPKSLEDNLAGLDEEARKFVLGEVTKARNEAKGLRRQLKDARPKVEEYDRLEAASKSDLERSQERTSRLTSRLVRAEIKAGAAEFADVEDAEAFLAAAKGGLERYVDSDGEVDAEQIAEDLADLLERKPHLGKQQGPRLPRPDPAQGAGGGGPASQLSRQELDRLYAEGKYEEIEKARKEGRLSKLMSGQ